MSPSAEYAERLNSRGLRVAHYERIHIRLGNLRLGLAFLAMVIGWASFGRHYFSAWLLVAPAGAFLAAAAYHSRVLRARELAVRAAMFYKNGMARLQDRWEEIGESGERFDDPRHVYSTDLDLFGKGSLFQLLSAARTRMGEDTLAGWLLSSSSIESIRQRHAAICELRDQLDLREDLAVLGEDAGVGVHPEALLHWSETPNCMKPLWLRWLAVALAALMVSATAVWIYFGTVAPLVLIVLLEAALTHRLRKGLEAVLHGTEHTFRDLDLLSAVLARFERHSFQAPRLRELQLEISSHGVKGSDAISQLRNLVNWIDSRHNIFLRMLDIPLMFSVQLAFAAERWRRKHGRAMGHWLTAVGEAEALLSLASYSFEHPADPFPDFLSGAPVFAAEGLGHPLIPASRCVRNDISFGEKNRVLLISGSNMSGKSTLLRAVGLNSVLAMAGGPVRASRLRLTALQVGASIRVNDSLREGSSRFYAEIARLRNILDLAGKNPPLLFLLDELLQGTNSKDRRIGAEGILRALVRRGSIGLVSTHDLALTDIESFGSGHLHNVHFQDELENGKMKFDYKLRDGVVTKSNGLELMRSVGLEV